MMTSCEKDYLTLDNINSAKAQKAYDLKNITDKLPNKKLEPKKKKKKNRLKKLKNRN